jgi:hypothetical protein
MVRSLEVASSGSGCSTALQAVPALLRVYLRKNGCRGRNCTAKERLMRPFGGYLSLHLTLGPLVGNAPTPVLYRSTCTRFGNSGINGGPRGISTHMVLSTASS